MCCSIPGFDHLGLLFKCVAFRPIQQLWSYRYVASFQWDFYPTLGCRDMLEIRTGEMYNHTITKAYLDSFRPKWLTSNRVVDQSFTSSVWQTAPMGGDGQSRIGLPSFFV